ncbi:UNVERIFIED_CONTAM: hypothetical protein RMT77_014473 [Armadillidium vulgare]
MVSRLENLCGIQMAIELANDFEFKKEILRLPDLDIYRSLWHNGEPWFENMEKKVLHVLEKLSFVFREKIPIPLVIFCLSQSVEWAKFHNEEFGLPFKYSFSLIKSSFFTSKGILNKEKAAREILKDTELSPSLKFCIACHYCLSDVIPGLWEQLPEDERPKVENEVYCNGFCIDGRKEMADIWSYLLLGELQILMEEDDDSFSLCKFKKTFVQVSYRNCSDVAFRKCFEELNESEKEKAVIFARNELKNFLGDMQIFGRDESDTTPYLFPLQLFLPYQKYLEMAIFFLHHLDERQLRVFFEPVLLHYVLFHSLSWPYQHMFMDIVSQFWEVLPKLGFSLLLHQIVRLIKNKSFSKLCDYHKILRDFWIQSSPSLKRFFFRMEGRRPPWEMNFVVTGEQRHDDDFRSDRLLSDFKRLHFSSVICELFNSPFTIKEEKIIRLIFESATLERKSSIVRLQGNRIGEIFFKACYLRRFDLFIECCVPKERIESFKKKLFNKWNVKGVLLSLVLNNKGKEFRQILNWAFSAEEIKEWLENFLLYVRQIRTYLYYHKDLKCFDKSLEFALSSNQIENFKKSLVLDGYFVRNNKNCLFEENFQDIDSFLEWIFPSKIKMVKFKKYFVFKMVRHMNRLLNGFDISLLNKFIEWSSLSEEDCKVFRRHLAFSEKVIEYYSKTRRQCEVVAFIRWAELGETEAKNFLLGNRSFAPNIRKRKVRRYIPY